MYNDHYLEGKMCEQNMYIQVIDRCSIIIIRYNKINKIMYDGKIHEIN